MTTKTAKFSIKATKVTATAGVRQTGLIGYLEAPELKEVMFADISIGFAFSLGYRSGLKQIEGDYIKTGNTSAILLAENSNSAEQRFRSFGKKERFAKKEMVAPLSIGYLLEPPVIQQLEVKSKKPKAKAKQPAAAAQAPWPFPTAASVAAAQAEQATQAAEPAVSETPTLLEEPVGVKSPDADSLRNIAKTAAERVINEAKQPKAKPVKPAKSKSGKASKSAKRSKK